MPSGIILGQTSTSQHAICHQPQLAFNTRTQTLQHLSPDPSISSPQPHVTPDVTEATDPTPNP